MEKCRLKRSAERLPRLGISTPAELELGIEAMKATSKERVHPKTRADRWISRDQLISCSSLSAARRRETS
jgi:hypothetical protein